MKIVKPQKVYFYLATHYRLWNYNVADKCEYEAMNEHILFLGLVKVTAF